MAAQPTKRGPFGARRLATVDGDLSATDITGRLGRRRGPQKNRFLKWLWANRRVTMLVLTVVLAGALLVAVPGLHKVVKRISHVNPWWIVLAVALEVASELSYVVMFRLFIDRGTPRDQRRMAWTELAAGQLLPGGGAGGMAIGGWLMYLAGAPGRWVVLRSEGLFFLSGAVSALGMILPGLALILGAPGPHGFYLAVLPTAVGIFGLVVIGGLPWILRSHPNAPSWVRVVSAGVEEGERITFSRFSWRLLGAVGYLGFDMAVLYVALRAVGVSPNVLAMMMAYTIGYVANVIPVPGGIGVLDAGLTGALSVYGMSSTNAAAAVLLYHAIALWVPGIGGLYAYLRLRPSILELSQGNAQLSVTDTSHDEDTSQDDEGEDDERSRSVA
jgi:uncharacterized membrane protein YbhN (UPF0104 family)